MPQMAPLNWLTLMTFFITILLIFNIANYYSFMYNTPMKTQQFNKKMLTNWKW